MFELLMLDLKRRSAALAGGKYVCQFDIKTPQHPLILLLDSKDIGSALFFGTKIKEICNHHDVQIRENSIEFLRPVFLHIFHNTALFPETQKIWRTLLKCAINDDSAVNMIYEILSWSRFTCAEKCLFTNDLILEALDALPEETRFDELRGNLCMYLAALCKSLVGFNFDPSTNLTKLFSVMKNLNNPMVDYSVLLMIMADLLLHLSPVYVHKLMKLARYLLKLGCNRLSQLMILDGVIQLLGQQTFIQNYLEDCDYILNAVLNEQYVTMRDNSYPTSKLFHPNLAKFNQFSKWWALVETEQTTVDAFLEELSHIQRFVGKIDLVLRGFLYMQTHPYETWKKTFEKLLWLSKSNEDACCKMITPILYMLANIDNPRKRLMLLQGLASMGSKEHVLCVLRALMKDVDTTTMYDLYLRLWKAEARTYPLLYDFLKDTKRRPQENSWETTLAKTYAIREICLIKPQQHGADLVNLFTEILNHPEDVDNEAAVALAIDAISSLCENHVINIVSTWKVLGFKFTNEKRPRIIRSLCKFFTNVALIKINSLEQEKLVNEIIEKLWHFLTDFDDREVILAALESLKSFPPDSMHISHIPSIFRQEIWSPTTDDESLEAKQIPGECWIQLVQYINHSAIEEAGDLVAHHICTEMQSYRGGVYLTPEGRPEPSSLRSLPKKSILAAVIHYLIAQSRKVETTRTNELVLLNLLRIIAKKYPKPIPPLDWSFLHHYFHSCMEMRKYCLTIATKQMPYSGTAKRLVENYINEMNEDNWTNENVLMLFESLDIIVETVRTDIYKKFIHLSFECLLQTSNDGALNMENSFGEALRLLKPVVSKSYQNEEHFDYLCITLENLFSRFDLHSMWFKNYVEILSVLCDRCCTSLLRPSTWVDKQNITKLEKVIYLQFNIHKYNKATTETHLLGLSDILKTVARFGAQDNSVRLYFHRSFYSFVSSFENQKLLTEWIIELMGYIQSNLAEKQSGQHEEVMFLVDVFLIAVISLSGYGSLFGANAVVKSHKEILSLFPPSLIMIFEENLWREIENKIYEFLYHLHNNHNIPSSYADCFRLALICCRGQSYFQQPKVCPKFVSLRRA
ncbi:focadhesin isoform X2 [Toxorhynchites rutilus septentrionalis]|nr:focadhesin isoform X2 [Toxorhynchites rutilus septentrionalis]